MRARPRRVPVPLAVLLALAAAVAIVWSLALPEFQGPDESGHVTYVERIAEGQTIPFAPRTGGGTRDLLLATPTEIRVAATESGLEQLRQNPAARPGWSAVDEALWARRAARLPPGARTDGNFNSVFRNPPLYYLYATPAYLVASGGSIFTRTQWMRWANVPLLMALVALTWALAGELLGPRLGPRALAAGLVALQPGISNAAGVVGPDLLLAVLYAAGLLLAVRTVRMGFSWPRLIGLVALCAAAGLTQGRGLPLGVPAALALLVVWLRARRPSRRLLAVAGALVATALAAGTLVILLAPTRGSSPGVASFLGYVWQFWTPTPSSAVRGIGPVGYGAGQAFVARLWGGFAQLEVELPSWAVTPLTVASLVLLAAIAWAVWRRRLGLRRSPGVAVVIAGAVLAFFALLHVTAYRSMLSDPSDPVITGRYLLPLLPLLAVGVADAVHALPRRHVALAGSAVVAAVAVLQLGAVALVVERFYA